MQSTDSNEPDIIKPPVPRFRELLPTAQSAAVRFLVGGVCPVAVFYVLFRGWGPAVGIGGGMAVSLAVLAIQARRIGRLDPVVLAPMALILIQGSIAIAFDSIEIYLLAPAAENALWAIVLLGSVALRRPLVAVIARELDLIPPAHRGSQSVASAMRQVTLAWGFGAVAKVVMRLWLLSALPLEAFLAAITAFHLTLNGSLLAFSFWWCLRKARQPVELGAGTVEV